MKNRILRSALSVALCAAMLLSQGLTVFADGEIDLAAAKSSPVQESSEESEAKTPTETLTPETKKELPASTEDETKTETTTGQPTAEDDTAKETTAKTPAVVSEEEKSEEATAAPAEAQAATNSLKSWGDCDRPSNQPTKEDFDNLIRQITVSISCKDETSHSTNWRNPYQLKDGDYDGPEKTGTNKYTITINSDHIAQNYVVDGVSHKLHGTQDKATITATWEKKFIGWYEWKITPVHININVEFDKGCHPDPIPEPSEENIAAQLEYKLTCTNENLSDKHSQSEYQKVTSDNIEIKNVDDTYSVEVKWDKILAEYNAEKGVTHTSEKLPTEPISLVYDEETKQWTVDGKTSFEINVKCDVIPSEPLTPARPSDDVIQKMFSVEMVCDNPNHENSTYYVAPADIKFTVGDVTEENGAYSFTVTLNSEAYLEIYNKNMEPVHSLSEESNQQNVTFTWVENKWNVNPTIVTINVLCDTKAPVEPTKPESDVLDTIIGSVSVKCVTNEKHTSSWSYLTSQLTEGSDYTIGELGNEKGKVTCTITYIAKAFADKYNELQTNIDHFPFNDVAVKLVWNDETSSWELENKNLLNNVLVSVGCVLSEEEILADNLSVMVDCISDLNHEDLTGLSLEKGTFSIDEPYQIAGEYFFDIEVQPDSYLKKYAEEHPTYPEHSGNAVKLTYQWKDTNWEPTISEISFKVTCEGPNIPSHEDVIKLLGGTMTVHCVNTNHNATETYGITWDSIGGLNKAPTDNGDGTYSLEITVSHDTYLKLFNQTYPNHKWATDDDMENEKVTLIWKDGEWSVEGKTDFSFNVDCNATAPGGDENPDNPGGGDNGNNGGNNNGGSTGGGSSVSRRDDDDDWEPLPNNNYRVTKKNDKPSQNTQIVVRDPADNSDNTSSNTGSDSGKHNPETGDTTTVFAAMALAAVSLGGAVLLGRKKK
mgnify:CR=1 FL=1